MVAILDLDLYETLKAEEIVKAKAYVGRRIY